MGAPQDENKTRRRGEEPYRTTETTEITEAPCSCHYERACPRGICFSMEAARSRSLGRRGDLVMTIHKKRILRGLRGEMIFDGNSLMRKSFRLLSLPISPYGSRSCGLDLPNLMILRNREGKKGGGVLRVITGFGSPRRHGAPLFLSLRAGFRPRGICFSMERAKSRSLAPKSGARDDNS